MTNYFLKYRKQIINIAFAGAAAFLFMKPEEPKILYAVYAGLAAGLFAFNQKLPPRPPLPQPPAEGQPPAQPTPANPQIDQSQTRVKGRPGQSRALELFDKVNIEKLLKPVDDPMEDQEKKHKKKYQLPDLNINIKRPKPVLKSSIKRVEEEEEADDVQEEQTETNTRLQDGEALREETQEETRSLEGFPKRKT